MSKETIETRTHYRQLYVKVDPGEVYAFIPGTIVDIFVEKGAEVKVGDPLCSLHAMKMDNIITSPIEGKVESVNIEKEQVVTRNDVLIKIG